MIAFFHWAFSGQWRARRATDSVPCQERGAEDKEFLVLFLLRKVDPSEEGSGDAGLCTP